MTRDQIEGRADACQPYRVQMACGHYEVRHARESTTGTPWHGPDTIWAGRVGGTRCVGCDPKRAELGAELAENQSGAVTVPPGRPQREWLEIVAGVERAQPERRHQLQTNMLDALDGQADLLRGDT